MPDFGNCSWRQEVLARSQEVPFAPNCFYSDRKRAGCTCPECTKLGGFAVNGEGIVDMGESGFKGISPVFQSTGKPEVALRLLR
jgi:hypothetical protein